MILLETKMNLHENDERDKCILCNGKLNERKVDHVKSKGELTFVFFLILSKFFRIGLIMSLAEL